MSLRFLVVEGNVKGPRERHRDTYGKTYAQSYGAVLQTIEKDCVYDIALPADEGANLPDASGLEAYDGIFLTGSALNAYHATPEILRQVDLMRAAYHLGNRHIPIELHAEHLKIEPDHVLADLMQSMGMQVQEVQEAFEPEGGAYGDSALLSHDHGHGPHPHHTHSHGSGSHHHDCGHDHPHSHDHGHDHGHAHDH